MAGGDQSRGSGRGLEQAKQVLYVCSSTAAHVIGITDPAMYRHNSHQTTELRNKEHKEQRKAALAEQDQCRTTMDRATAS